MESLLGGWLVNPALLAAGSLLVSAPIIIHLLSQRRFRTLDWAAMEFLIQAEQRNRRRIQLEELLLLALRCLAVLLAALLVARPEHLAVLRGLAWSVLQCGDSLGCLRLTDRYEQAAGGLSPGLQFLPGRALFGLGRTDEARDTLMPGSEVPVVVRP